MVKVRSKWDNYRTFHLLSPEVSTQNMSIQPEVKTETLRHSPIVTYLDEISPKDKFLYLVLILIIVLFIYRINFHWSIWIGLIVGLFSVYYTNERQALQLNNCADQLWAVLRGPLLIKTKYFITDPPLIRWVDNVKEFKSANVVEFNKMITNLDKFLKLIYQIKLGVYHCKENLDIIRDLKVQILNQFHSIVHQIKNVNLRSKFHDHLDQLSYLLNQRHANLIKICQLYYILKPINIDSKLDVTSIKDPSAYDPRYNPNYHYFN